MRDEETSGEAPASIGEQEESAAQPQYSTTAPAIAAPGLSKAGSASRSGGQDANSGIKEHKALPGDFTPHRGTSTLNGVSVGSAVATASADKVSVDSGALPMQQSMARSAHEAVAGGASAATGQGIGTNVVLGHTSAPDASAWVRDPVNVHGTAGATAGHGDSPVTQAAAPQETFATLDAGTSVGTPNWIHAGGHRPGTLADDGLRQHDRRRGPVAGDIVGLGGDLAHHLRAHVLELVGEFDLLGDRHAILGDAWRAVTLVEDHVATLRAERDPYGLGERVDAAQHTLAGIATEPNVLGSHLLNPS
jgi:hypothetical protein